MTAPRTAREYRPAWHEPRHGVRRALACWALAWAIALAALALWHSRASGQTAGSIALYNASGGVYCHATPTRTGLRLAAHCIHGATVRIAGTDYPASVDPLRDLAHVLAAPYAAEAHERTPVAGEAVEWRNTRGVGGGSIRAVWYADGRTMAGGEVNDVPAGPTWYPVLVICHEHGRRIIPGDSGTGIVAGDGALVGIVTRASLDAGTDAQGPCGGAQFVVAVMVP